MGPWVMILTGFAICKALDAKVIVDAGRFGAGDANLRDFSD